MKTKELKSLKDLERKDWNGLRCASIVQLKAEAVKWVKEINNNPEPYGTNILSGLNRKQREITKARAINLFKDFFNIIEDDLKERIEGK